MRTYKQDVLHYTDDYSLFRRNTLNRPVRGNSKLVESMRTHGWISSKPMTCRMEDGRLVIVDGHHRYTIAKKFEIGIYFVVLPPEVEVDVIGLESSSNARWNLPDAVKGRAGDSKSKSRLDCKVVVEWHERTQLSPGVLLDLLGAAGRNRAADVHDDTFAVAEDLTLAKRVVSVTEHCRRKGLKFATCAAFARGLAAALDLGDVDERRLARQIVTYHATLIGGSAPSNHKTWVSLLHKLYNFHSKTRVDIEFRALERERQKKNALAKLRPQGSVQ